jgi:hypothetical protein
MVQWTTCLLPVVRNQGSNPLGGVLIWNRYSPVSVISLHWWPQHDSDHWLRRPSMGASLGSVPTMCKPGSTWSHNSSIPVSRSLQVPLPASQPKESASWGEPCGEPAISLHSHHVSLVQWTTRLLPVMRDPGSNPRGGVLCENLLLVLSRYIPKLT